MAPSKRPHDPWQDYDASVVEQECSAHKRVELTRSVVSSRDAWQDYEADPVCEEQEGDCLTDEDAEQGPPSHQLAQEEVLELPR